MPKYLDLDGLKTYDGKMKSLLNEGAAVGTGVDIDDPDNLNALKAQHFETQVTYGGTAYDGTLITQQSSTKSFATQLFIGWRGIVLRRTMQSGNWNSWEKIAAGTADNGIIELPNQYNRITDLDTGIYKLTYNGTKQLYYYGTTNTLNVHTIATSTAPCLLYVQKYSTTYWHWEYSYANSSIRKTIKGWTSTSSGGSSTLYLPSGMGTKGQFLQSNGASAPSWVSLYAPTTAGTSGQFLKSSGSGAPVWGDVPAPTFLPIYAHFGAGLTIKGLGELSGSGVTMGYKCKITSITGDQPPKIYPTNHTFCFWYGSINTPVTYVDKQGQLCDVSDLTFLIDAGSYLAYMLKNNANNEVSFYDGCAFTICAYTANMFSMTKAKYYTM